MACLQFVTVAAIIFAIGEIAQTSTIKRFPSTFEEQVQLRKTERYTRIEAIKVEPNYRLPNNTLPIHYDVELTTNIHKGDLDYKGVVVITIKVEEENTENVVVHAGQLQDVEATILNVETQEKIDLSISSNDTDTELLTFTPKDNFILVKGKIYEVTIKYSTRLREDNRGFYVSTYTNAAGKTVNMATTQFAPTDARHAFPCYDEPAKRATFTITINHDPSLNVISNMPEDPNKSSIGKTAFQQTPNMPTYLVAFIVSDFQYTSGSLNALPQRVFSRNGTHADREFALFTGIKMIERLTEYFGVPFPLPKLDQVAIPDFAAGAMENWGLVTYREENLLYNPKNSTLIVQTKAANIIGHEYTHFWFGNLVTIKWWTWLWLKEGFANFFSYKAANEVYPEWDIEQKLITNEYQKALLLDGEEGTRPMTHYAQKQSEIRSLYDSIAYSKSGSVLRMWQHALSDEIFRAGLNKYLISNQYTGAEEDDLFDAIAGAAKEANLELPDTVHDMMKTWTNQGGVPLLTVTRNYDEGSFSISQKSFHNDEAFDDSKLWYIPLNFATNNNSDFRNTTADFYLKDKAIVVKESGISENDWIILNKQSTGYYRINYDEQNWDLITDSLISNPNKIHTNNRASLINDAYSLVTTSQLKHSYLLRLMTYLKNEDQYAPWETANSILTTFDRFFRITYDIRYRSFQTYVSDLVGNTYSRLGMQYSTGEHQLTNNVRTIAANLACMVNALNCLDDSWAKLKGLVEKGIEIEPNIRSVIYCNGLKNGGDAEFDYLYNRLMKSEEQAERTILISALGCSPDFDNLMKFVESSISKSENVTLRTQERITLLSSAYSQGYLGRTASYYFLIHNYNAYADLTGSFAGTNPLDADIKEMSKFVVDSIQEEYILRLVKTVKNHPKVSSNLEATVKANLQRNIRWRDLNEEHVMEWLSENYKISGASNAFGSITPVFIVMCYVIARVL